MLWISLLRDDGSLWHLGLRVALGLDNLMPLACERPWQLASLRAFRGGQGWNRPGEPPEGPSPQLPASTALILQGKRVVSQNWARSTHGPGVANEMLTDEELEDHTDAFCLGERVELAVTMENKAEVSRAGSGSPGARPVASSPPARPHCQHSPPPGQADRE